MNEFANNVNLAVNNLIGRGVCFGQKVLLSDLAAELNVVSFTAFCGLLERANKLDLVTLQRIDLVDVLTDAQREGSKLRGDAAYAVHAR